MGGWLWRREPRLTWQERHPLPAGWRPRTRIDAVGREVEPWLFTVFVGTDAYDAGEWWLPVGHDEDQAAYTILNGWLASSADGLGRHELRQTRIAVRSAAVQVRRVGVAVVEETALAR